MQRTWEGIIVWTEDIFRMYPVTTVVFLVLALVLASLVSLFF